MRFTAVMDENDEESSHRGPGTFGPGVSPPRAGTARQERQRESAGHGQQVEVKGLDEDARHSIRDELQLLATLEVAGITAAPNVLEIEDDGYLREAAPPLRRRSGRRAAEDCAPPTAERLALARARDDLDDLIDAVHQRGWVLGAGPGQGLGVRPDGSVVALDLAGLRRDETLSARQADRRWVDSVLGDQERTLRRRIDLVAPSWPLQERSLLGPGPAAEVLMEPAAQAASGQAASGQEAEAELEGPDGVEGPEVEHAGAALPRPRRLRRRERGEFAAVGVYGRRTPHPAGLRTLVGPLTGTGRRGLSAIRQVLSQPPLRRVAVGSALVVLLLGSTAAMGAWWASERPAQAPGHEQLPVATPAPPSGAPRIEDPWALVADVAGARHAYISGVSAQPVAVPGSEAFTADEETRLAYQGHQVRGGGPVVHEAELLAGPDGDGTVVLRAVTSTAEHELEDRAGQLTHVPATAPREVRLTLHWNGERWLVEAVEAVEEVEAVEPDEPVQPGEPVEPDQLAEPAPGDTGAS